MVHCEWEYEPGKSSQTAKYAKDAKRTTNRSKDVEDRATNGSIHLSSDTNRETIAFIAGCVILFFRVISAFRGSLTGRFRMKHLLLRWCVPTMLWLLTASAGFGNAQSTNLTFVYVHGFGGEKADPQFCVNMREFLAEAKIPARVANYPWDSVEVDVLKAGASWRESERRADEESQRFASTVIDKYEQSQTPYVLVGFSVGSRVVLGALEARKGQLKSLQAVYFLGSAMARDTSLPKDVLPPGMRITNYHSPLRDKVHKTAFSFMSGLPAGGEVGYDDDLVFENYAVSCTHAYKGVGVHIDYSQLAVAIGYIELFKKGIIIPGRLNFNLGSRVGEGDIWWNKVLQVSATVRGKRMPVVIEQSNMRADYFRALVIKKDGSRKRIARGRNLHAIFRFLKVDSLNTSDS